MIYINKKRRGGKENLLWRKKEKKGDQSRDQIRVVKAAFIRKTFGKKGDHSRGEGGKT